MKGPLEERKVRRAHAPLTPFGILVRQLRLGNDGMTLGDHAAVMGCKPGHLSAIERGGVPAATDTVEQMADTLGVTGLDREKFIYTALSSNDRSCLRIHRTEHHDHAFNTMMKLYSRMHSLTNEQFEKIQEILDSK